MHINFIGKYKEYIKFCSTFSTTAILPFFFGLNNIISINILFFIFQSLKNILFPHTFLLVNFSRHFFNIVIFVSRIFFQQESFFITLTHVEQDFATREFTSTRFI